MKLRDRLAPGPGVTSKVKLALGAASLFLFIVGLKRTYQMDDGRDSAGTSDGAEQPAR